jgi:hypothetical protein
MVVTIQFKNSVGTERFELRLPPLGGGRGPWITGPDVFRTLAAFDIYPGLLNIRLVHQGAALVYLTALMEMDPAITVIGPDSSMFFDMLRASAAPASYPLGGRTTTKKLSRSRRSRRSSTSSCTKRYTHKRKAQRT